jgi:(R,R)-butanediol dehydrogenase / meso-butanediol dehydrogenase / diacetyl reductase
MRSLVYREPGRMELVESGKPEAGAGEALVRMKYCGICGSDVHNYRNGLSIPGGTVMGHENVGTVEALGPGVAGWAQGERVIVNPLARCGHCYWCERGEYSLCETGIAEEIGFHPEYPGGLANYLLIRHPEAMLLGVPASVGMEEAALAEPLATSLHALRKSRFRRGDEVLVIGAGMIGLGLICFLKLAGARRIVAFEPSPAKAELAGRLGADRVLDPSGGREGSLRAVLAESGGLGFPLVFECSGVASAFRDASTYARKGGQVVVVGFCETEVGVRPLDWILKEIEVKAILGYYDEFQDVIAALERKEIPAASFITDIVSLERAEEAGYRRIMRDADAVKILVDLER